MKTLDKEGLQYTLQRIVTLLEKKKKKVDAPYPEYKEGTWEAVLLNTGTEEATVVSMASGFYYKIGNLVFIEGFILANNAYACNHISGLPFEPSHARPSNTYPLSIVARGANENAPFNAISGTKSYSVYNALYSPDKTYNTWYVHGWYKAADTK